MAKKPTVVDLLQRIVTLLERTTTITPFPQPRVINDRFTDNGDGTVTDNQEKLIWYPTLEKKFTWEEAKKECAKIGCRLPTTHELFSLVDVNKYNPAIDKEIFPETNTYDYYWTGDSCPWGAGSARIVAFYYGNVSDYNKGNDNYVRPVRASQ